MFRLDTVLAVVAAAAEYWQADDVALFFATTSTDAIAPHADIPQQVNPFEWAPEMRLAA